ncbi:MAG: hypothetical protein WDM92_12295 [Caulobacteraceae bacterium]
MAEIEASSRLYQQNGATFMTATLLCGGPEGDPPTAAPGHLRADRRSAGHHPLRRPARLRRLRRLGRAPAGAAAPAGLTSSWACWRRWTTAPPTFWSGSPRTWRRSRGRSSARGRAGNFKTILSELGGAQSRQRQGAREPGQPGAAAQLRQPRAPGRRQPRRPRAAPLAAARRAVPEPSTRPMCRAT